jgi:NADH:ubiquinone oxidoreductase subunit F (NADH-binding)
VSSAILTASEGERRRSGPTGLPRLLETVRDDHHAVTFEHHVERYGTIREAIRGGELVAELDRSGLAGRGGASFPTAQKLRAVAARRGRPVVVVNGAEGEPTSAKDRALLRTVPHLVLDGAVLAADAVGAREIHVAVCRDSRLEFAALQGAVAERARSGGDPRVFIHVVSVPTGFVVGEETALVQFLNGGPAKPTFTPPRPFERGVRGAPTLVQNVETLAHLALIARFGGDWFRGLGTRSEPGSVLVTISGAVRRPGVHELALGTSFASLVEEAGGLTAPVSAFLVGGYFGSWVSADVAPNLRLLDADLGRYGASLGARAVLAMPVDACALAEVARAARYLAGESAGQCGPCVHGLAAIAEGVERLVGGMGDDRAALARWVEVVRGRGACKHPDGATRFVTSALEIFADEVETHVKYGRCRTPFARVLPIPEQTSS